MRWLLGLYSRRIVNVNVNIIVAGMLSLMLTLIPVHLTHYFTDNHAVIMVVTFVADLIFDVVIYYVLHWLANHWPGRRAKTGEVSLEQAARPSFFKDATLVQFERALLSPILYAVSFGLQFYLLRRGLEREWATVVGLSCGILTTRVLHTLWMVRSARVKQGPPLAAPVVPHTGQPAKNGSGVGGLGEPGARTGAEVRT